MKKTLYNVALCLSILWAFIYLLGLLTVVLPGNTDGPKGELCHPCIVAYAGPLVFLAYVFVRWLARQIRGTLRAHRPE